MIAVSPEARHSSARARRPSGCERRSATTGTVTRGTLPRIVPACNCSLTATHEPVPPRPGGRRRRSRERTREPVNRTPDRRAVGGRAGCPSACDRLPKPLPRPATGCRNPCHAPGG